MSFWHSVTHGFKKAVEALEKPFKETEKVAHKVVDDVEHLGKKAGVNDLVDKAGDVSAKVLTGGLVSGSDVKGAFDKGKDIAKFTSPKGIVDLADTLTGAKPSAVSEEDTIIEDPQAPIMHSVAQDTYNTQLSQGRFGKGTSDRYGALGGDAFNKLARKLR